MKTLLLVASLFAGATAWTRDATTGCITFAAPEVFDKTVDYFPHKTEVQHATKWDVIYNKFYKTATVKSAVTYQLLQCFTDAAEHAKAVAELPACVLPNCKRLTIPTTAVALGENSKVLGFLEEIQEVKSVKYAFHPSVSPCLQSLTVGKTNADDATQAAAVKVFFLAGNDAAAANTAKHVKLAMGEEPSPRGRAAWVLFVSLFYNKEGLANYVYSRTVVAYDAQVALTGALPKIKYAWVDSFAGGKIKFTSSVYVRSLITAAGGELVHFGETISAADASAQLKLVDAVIISDTNRHTSMTTVRAQLGVDTSTDFRLNRGNGVYNIYQIDRFRSAAHTFVYWEEEVSASPDLILSDLVKSARTVTPWTSAFYMFVRRVSDSPAIVAQKSFFCDRIGLHGRSNAKEIRKTALSQMKQVASNPTGTVTAVAGTDYFPDKSDELLHAELYEIEYHLTWKFVRSYKDNLNLILIQKGTTPPPANILPDAKRFQIPVDTISCAETPTTAFQTILGNLPKIKYSGESTYPCVLKAIKAGTIKAIGKFGTPDAYNKVEAEKNDVILGSKWVSGIAASPKGVIVSATSDPGPLHRSEWLNLHATFTNSEKRANELFTEIRSRYLCVAQKGKSASLTAGRTPLIAWVGSPFKAGYAYKATTARYKIDLAEHSGGLLAATVAGSKMVQHGTTIGTGVFYTDAAALRAALADVDVLVDEHWYGGAVPDKAAVYTKLGFTDANAKDFKFVKNKALFRDDKSLTTTGSTDVFMRYVVQPDAVVEDLITALHPGWEPSNTAGTHFYRNVIKGETHNVPDVKDCPDVNALEPLLTRRSTQCFVPCSERTDRDYCKLDCVATELTGGSILCAAKTAVPAPLTPVPGAPVTNNTNAPGTSPTGTPTTVCSPCSLLAHTHPHLTHSPRASLRLSWTSLVRFSAWTLTVPRPARASRSSRACEPAPPPHPSLCP